MPIPWGYVPQTIMGADGQPFTTAVPAPPPAGTDTAPVPFLQPPPGPQMSMAPLGAPNPALRPSTDPATLEEIQAAMGAPAGVDSGTANFIQAPPTDFVTTRKVLHDGDTRTGAEKRDAKVDARGEPPQYQQQGGVEPSAANGQPSLDSQIPAAPQYGGIDYSALEKAYKEKAAVDKGQAEASFAGMKRYSELMAQNEAQQRDFNQRVSLSMEEHEKRLRSYSDQIDRVNTTIDPNRWWNSQNTAQKILGSLAIAVGTPGPGMRNQALDYMNEAITRDIDAQKASVDGALGKTKQRWAQENTLYGVAKERFSDDATRLAATRAGALSVVEQQIKTAIAGTKSDEIKSGLSELLAQVGIKKQQEIQAAGQKAFENASTRIKLENDTLQTRAQLAAASAKQDPNAAKKQEFLTAVEDRYQAIQRDGGKLQALISKYGTSEKYEPGVQEQMNQLVDEMALDAAKLHDPTSVVTRAEARDQIVNIFSPGVFQRATTAQTALQSFMDLAKDRRNSAYKVRGYGAPPEASDAAAQLGGTKL